MFVFVIVNPLQWPIFTTTIQENQKFYDNVTCSIDPIPLPLDISKLCYSVLKQDFPFLISSINHHSETQISIKRVLATYWEQTELYLKTFLSFFANCFEKLRLFRGGEVISACRWVASWHYSLSSFTWYNQRMQCKRMNGWDRRRWSQLLTWFSNQRRGRRLTGGGRSWPVTEQERWSWGVAVMGTGEEGTGSTWWTNQMCRFGGWSLSC